MEVMTQSAELIDMEVSVHLLRRALERAFSKVAFEVSIHGEDVRVTWTDGPTQRDVNKVARLYSGQDYGELASEEVDHWLTDECVSIRASGPDNFVLPARLVPPGARRVRFAPSRVWLDRQLSDDFCTELSEMLVEHTDSAFDPTSERVYEIGFRGVVLKGFGPRLIWQASCYVRRDVKEE